MNEHGRARRIELADGVGYAIDALVSRAAASGEAISTGTAVKDLLAQYPDAETTAAEMAEALVRAAAAKGLAVSVPKPD